MPATSRSLASNRRRHAIDADRVKGQAKDVKGSAKETIGKAIGDKETERSGQADQVEGKVQKGVGKVKDALRDDK